LDESKATRVREKVTGREKKLGEKKEEILS